MKHFGFCWCRFKPASGSNATTTCLLSTSAPTSTGSCSNRPNYNVLRKGQIRQRFEQPTSTTAECQSSVIEDVLFLRDDGNSNSNSKLVECEDSDNNNFKLNELITSANESIDVLFEQCANSLESILIDEQRQSTTSSTNERQLNEYEGMKMITKENENETSEEQESTFNELNANSQIIKQKNENKNKEQAKKEKVASGLSTGNSVASPQQQQQQQRRQQQLGQQESGDDDVMSNANSHYSLARQKQNPLRQVSPLTTLSSSSSSSSSVSLKRQKSNNNNNNNNTITTTTNPSKRLALMIESKARQN